MDKISSSMKLVRFSFFFFHQKIAKILFQTWQNDREKFQLTHD